MRRASIITGLVIVACSAPAWAGQAVQNTPLSERVQTTDEANRQDLSGAAQAPLRDLNLVRTKIPLVLQEALANPYLKPRHLRCEEIQAEITPLDEALGPDLDQPSTKDDGHLIEKGREAAGEAALGAVAGAAQDLIPFRGWVRKLTGAERHDRLVRAAITAGAIRRGYLKGLGETKGCKPPTAPSPPPPPVESPTPPPVVNQPGKPHYPIG